MKADKDARPVVGAITLVDEFTVLLVESKTGKWIFPKGGLNEDELPHQASAREAFEEAGVVGNIIEAPFCIKNEITFFILNVKSIEDKYPEKSKRRRKLMMMEDALNDNNVSNYVKEVIRMYAKKEMTNCSNIFCFDC
ncbi:hypothetical protein GINT2_001503 [Glugoides intestinalis]